MFLMPRYAQNLLLLMILAITLKLAYAGEFETMITTPTEESAATAINTLPKIQTVYRKLFQSLTIENWEEFVESINILQETYNIELNNILPEQTETLLRFLIIRYLAHPLEFNKMAIEHLLLLGANPNAYLNEGENKELPIELIFGICQHPLEVDKELFFELIATFLDHGVIITEKTLKSANKKEDLQEILPELIEHQELLNNPTKELLLKAIICNKFHLVELIINNKPELVDLEDIQLAQESCPTSIPFLIKALKITKFRKFAMGIQFPIELVQYIEPFIKNN